MRLLSLAPSNTEILHALGLENQIIGVTAYCDYPPEAKKKPKVGSWISTELEKIKQAKPDLIFTSYFLPDIFKNWSGPGEVVHVEPKTLEDVYNSIKILGNVTKRIKNAERIIEEMRRNFDRIYQIQPTTIKKVYMEEWPQPPFVSGNWVPELAKIAGGIPVLAEKGKPSREVSFDELQKVDPDVIIFHWCGYGQRFNKELILKREGWKKLRAVRNNKLFVIDDSLLNRPSPRLTQGARKIQLVLRD